MMLKHYFNEHQYAIHTTQCIARSVPFRARRGKKPRGLCCNWQLAREVNVLGDCAPVVHVVKVRHQQGGGGVFVQLHVCDAHNFRREFEAVLQRAEKQYHKYIYLISNYQISIQLINKMCV